MMSANVLDSYKEFQNENSDNADDSEDDLPMPRDRRFTQSMEWPPRKQSRTIETVEVGCLNIISAKYESLDYDIPDSTLIVDEERTKGYSYEVKKDTWRWIVFIFIGVCTACIGFVLDSSIDILSTYKYGVLKTYVDKCVQENCLYIPYIMWIGSNVVVSLIGSYLVTYVEPIAAGSGIPQVKCYLNGIKIPHVVRFKTLVVKVVGVICSVVGGLAVGKEGPMIHSGAVVAAGISQGKSTSFNKDFHIFNFFREDHEKRDFVSGGAAAGVAAAFGAPIGGVLFSLEEGTSFWNQGLTWRVFLSALISAFTLNTILSTYYGKAGQLWYAGLLNFGKFPEVAYALYEIPIFMGMGVIGGLLGATFNHINYKITVFRMRYINNTKWMKILEVATVASICATIGFMMIYFLNDCRPLGQDPTKFPVQMFCGDGEYNALAAIWFQTPETSVRSLFHDPAGSHKATSLGLFFILYFMLSIWTYGLSISAGLFIPALLTGAAWGRLTGMGLAWLFPAQEWIDLRKYALIGAAAQLGGVVRMTISLTVILIEATGSISFGLPLMMTLITAKYVGDYFNEADLVPSQRMNRLILRDCRKQRVANCHGCNLPNQSGASLTGASIYQANQGIYDIHIMLSGVPLIPWEPPPQSRNIYASEVMSHPVVVFRTVERVSRLVQVLKAETHNGFPVVDPSSKPRGDSIAFGRLRGLILRSQLIVLLENKIFDQNEKLWSTNADIVQQKLFRNEYPRFKDIKDITLAPGEMKFTIDLRPYMNSSPYTVQHSASLPRVFRLFRGLGLRHLPVLDDQHEVVGMVTRKDLVRYRVWRHRGRMGREELKISEKI